MNKMLLVQAAVEWQQNGGAAWYSSATLSLCLSSLAVVLVIGGVAVSVIGGGIVGVGVVSVAIRRRSAPELH